MDSYVRRYLDPPTEVDPTVTTELDGLAAMLDTALDQIEHLRRDLAAVRRRALLAATRPAVLTADRATEGAGAEIRDWLGKLMPAWGAEENVMMAGNCWRGPIVGGTAVDFGCHPNPHSRTMPVGALIRALEAVADLGGPAAETVRDVLRAHRVPAIAESRQEEDLAMAALEAER